jgi:hypothetical protein
MARGLFIGGGVFALLSGIAALVLATLVVVSETPEAHVERYLAALADDDLLAAARLAGLPAGEPLPLGDEGTPTTVRVVTAQERPAGRVAVTTVYGGDADAATVIFVLEPDASLLGVIPQWRFVAPPVARIPVGIDQHNRVLVAGRAVTTNAPGGTTTVSAFIPARVSVTNADPFLTAPPRATRPRAVNPDPIILRAEPSTRLVREVERQVVTVLDTCAEQTVLQPAGCPFGRVIDDDRVLDRPTWQRVDTPQVTLMRSEIAGRFSLEGRVTMRISVSVQSLFDGSVTELTDDISVDLSGIVGIGPDGPVVTVYP